jgi:phosphodiesterase/alkaline phosphatase D-like protein
MPIRYLMGLLPTREERCLLADGATARAARAAPFNLVRSGRPSLTHGIQSGDVTATRAVVWARSDRPARMVVEVSTAGLRFFGHVTIDAATAVMTVRLRDLAGATLYSVDLDPPG